MIPSTRWSIRFGAVVGAIALGTLASATHSWSTYHWARTANPFTLKVTDSVTAVWQYSFDQSLIEWGASTKINLAVANADDGSRTRKQCRAITGEMRVCNASYGKNGWLGLASIGLDNKGHIDRGTAKMNDSYDSYFTPEERNHVMCQEIGHVFGLGHTSEDGSSQSTCMDYSQSVNSQWPNNHDYQQLDSIYQHLDTYNSFNTSMAAAATTHGSAADAMNDNVPMGLLVHKSEHEEVYVAARPDGGYWVHHVRLAPDHDHASHAH